MTALYVNERPVLGRYAPWSARLLAALVLALIGAAATWVLTHIVTFLNRWGSGLLLLTAFLTVPNPF